MIPSPRPQTIVLFPKNRSPIVPFCRSSKHSLLLGRAGQPLCCVSLLMSAQGCGVALKGWGEARFKAEDFV